MIRIRGSSYGPAVLCAVLALTVACSLRNQTNAIPVDDGSGAPSPTPSNGTNGSSGEANAGANAGASGSGTDSGTTTGAGGTDASSSSPPPSPPVDAGPVATQPAVTSFTLINADTDQPITGFDPIAEGATITLADLPTPNLTIAANVATNGVTIGSISFDFDGTVGFHVENTAPYDLAGDNAGDYNPLDPPLAAGAHTLRATPYTDAAAAGTAGLGKTVTFTVQ